MDFIHGMQQVACMRLNMALTPSQFRLIQAAMENLDQILIAAKSDERSPRERAERAELLRIASSRASMATAADEDLDELEDKAYKSTIPLDDSDLISE